MLLSEPIRRLFAPWDDNTKWPLRLLSVEINGLRGWSGQRADFNFPIVAIVGENGAGKSSIIQAAASIYQSSDSSRFPSKFFPDTAWDQSNSVEIKAEVRQGNATSSVSVRKPTNRWRGNRERPVRPVVYMDLSRLMPVASRTGYQRIVNLGRAEASATHFDETRLQRLSTILGRPYANARSAFSDVDNKRDVPVLSFGGHAYSGFHQGAGEITIAELLKTRLPNNCLLLIDEVETSLHPRSQRRLIRDLAEICRSQNIQVIITTHSPYILEELPERARLQIIRGDVSKEIVIGVSPEFAMSKMDDNRHSSVDVYVEDSAAKVLVEEILAVNDRNLLSEVNVSQCGPASVGKSLGQMVANNRFSKPTVVFLDGDQDPCVGCNILPGSSAPEVFIFREISDGNYFDLSERLGRSFAEVSDAVSVAMTLPDHHLWVSHISNSIRVPPQTVWQSMAGAWVNHGCTEQQKNSVLEPIRLALQR